MHSNAHCAHARVQVGHDFWNCVVYPRTPDTLGGRVSAARLNASASSRHAGPASPLQCRVRTRARPRRSRFLELLYVAKKFKHTSLRRLKHLRKVILFEIFRFLSDYPPTDSERFQTQYNCYSEHLSENMNYSKGIKTR